MTSRPGRQWYLALLVGYVLAAAFAFGPGLRAGFVSDTFLFIEGVRNASRDEVAQWFVPADDRFYRPLYLVALLGTNRLFGTEPLGYHLVAWMAHVASAVLLSAIALTLTGQRMAAVFAGLSFLWSIHAHEVVFDVATLHHALGGLMLLVAVLAGMRQARALSVFAAAIGLLTNELALLVLPILAVYELTREAGSRSPARFGAGLARIAPHAALVAGYFVLRLVVAGADLPQEVQTCLGPRCLAVALLEYANRLIVRPEWAVGLVWRHRPAVAGVMLVLTAALAALLRIWRWRRWRDGAFAGGWAAVAVAYAVLALWPYVSDRFLYVPDMGLSLLLGWALSQGSRVWRDTAGLGRAATGIALGLVIVWIAAGGFMLRARGELWWAAGREAQRIVDEIHALAPAPPPGASFCVVDRVDSYATTVAPGNTGPYLFRNGLASALRLRYGRPDLVIVRDCSTASAVFSVSEAPVRLLRP